MDWAVSCVVVFLLWYLDFMSMSERRKREWNENLIPISRWWQILSPTFLQMVSSVHTPKTEHHRKNQQNLHPTKQCRNSTMRRILLRRKLKVMLCQMKIVFKFLLDWLLRIYRRPSDLIFLKGFANIVLPTDISTKEYVHTCLLPFLCVWLSRRSGITNIARPTDVLISLSFSLEARKRWVILWSVNFLSLMKSKLTWKRYYQSSVHINIDCHR